MNTNIPIEVGKKYEVRHSRKGKLSIRITELDSDGPWITGIIIGGRARAMMQYNEREKGEEITIRDEHCYFIPIPDRNPATRATP